MERAVVLAERLTFPQHNRVPKFDAAGCRFPSRFWGTGYYRLHVVVKLHVRRDYMRSWRTVVDPSSGVPRTPWPYFKTSPLRSHAYVHSCQKLRTVRKFSLSTMSGALLTIISVRASA